ncbi:hypothetical protein T07_12268 [Trichinella nelsoni]|uniref:Uncharacterized protein n=1 Tax=Trichinella nelsoni TaxID=6336 RepID=A0A0V0RZY0_9BILA|nr:hypothetical protein T07_12268 [Trichinella nelsoni]
MFVVCFAYTLDAEERKNKNMKRPYFEKFWKFPSKTKFITYNTKQNNTTLSGKSESKKKFQVLSYIITLHITNDVKQSKKCGFTVHSATG